MDAIKYILSEHQRIKKMLASLTKASRTLAARRKMFVTVSKFLKTHEKMEQTIWYPYLKKNTNLAPVIKRLMTEEKRAAKALVKTKAIKQEEKFNKNLLVLKTEVLAHAKDEETKLFPRAKKQVSREDLAKLGVKLQSFRKRASKKSTPATKVLAKKAHRKTESHSFFSYFTS